ncbi:MAG: FkbM family methyltransferase [Chitinophagaceae bacterium]|nr:FkbM family methyltransferase [Chitinophagaceae bacterium]
MSRFSLLRKYLSLNEAISIYFKMKSGQYKGWKLKKLTHPVCLRNNPYDYATFEEVILKEEYKLPGDFKPLTIIDAGANIGLTSAYFASKYPAASIVSLEPDLENFNWLKNNVKLYGNVHPMLAGLWNQSGHLVITHTNEGNNAFRVEVLPGYQEGSIAALTVSEIMRLQNWKTVDLLKIDVEGAEKEIFEKNTDWLPKVKMIALELHDRFKPGCADAVFAATGKYNFTFYLQGENHIFVNQDM